MQTNNFYRFFSIYDNYVNGNIADYKTGLNKLTKVDLIRFNNWLKFNGYKRHVDVNSFSKLIIIED